MSTPWAHRFAQRTKAVKSSTIRELLKLTQRPEVISFAGGLPAPEVFPVERFENACHRVLESKGAMALQYSASEGYTPLREYLAQKMARYGIIAGVMAGLGRVMAEVGAIIIVGGNIAGQTRVLTTAIVLDTAEANYLEASILGVILFVLAFVVFAAFQRLESEGVV